MYNFSWLSTIKDFVTSFPSLTLYAVNLLLLKKIISLTFCKTITVSRTSKILRIFLMGRSEFSTKGTTWGLEELEVQKFEPPTSVGYSPPPGKCQSWGYIKVSATDFCLRGLPCLLCKHLLQNVIQQNIEIMYFDWCMITTTKSFTGYIFSS